MAAPNHRVDNASHQIGKDCESAGSFTLYFGSTLHVLEDYLVQQQLCDLIIVLKLSFFKL